MLRSAPSQIEADILQFCPGRRIAEFWRTVGPRQTGEMTPRELCVIVHELPDVSRYKRRREHAWTLFEELAARVGNLLQAYRQDYRNAHGAEHEWEPVTAPELAHERRAREAKERESQHRATLGPAVFDLMLRGELKMTDIDPSRPIEEALQGVA